MARLVSAAALRRWKSAEPCSSADSRWLLVAALSAIRILHVLYSEMYRWAFATVEIPGKPLSMLNTLLGSLVVGMVAPAWSAAGTALICG